MTHNLLGLIPDVVCLWFLQTCVLVSHFVRNYQSKVRNGTSRRSTGPALQCLCVRVFGRTPVKSEWQFPKVDCKNISLMRSPRSFDSIISDGFAPMVKQFTDSHKSKVTGVVYTMKECFLVN